MHYTILVFEETGAVVASRVGSRYTLTCFNETCDIEVLPLSTLTWF